MNKSLLDTDIFSEIIKNKDEKVAQKAECYLTFFPLFTISNISVLEIVKGFQKKKRYDKVNEFLNTSQSCEILYLTYDSTLLAARILADLELIGNPIELTDLLIASIAISNNLTLVTGNFKHYEPVQKLGYDLILDNWR